MSNDGGDMSDEELDDLLDDLESRADEGGVDPSGSEVQGEDLDEFFQELEEKHGSEEGEGEVSEKVLERDGESSGGPDLSDLEGLEESGGEVATSSSQAPDTSNEGGTAAVEQADGEDEAQESGRSPWARRALTAVKWAAFVLPVLVLWWVVGAYLQQWIRPQAVFLVPVVSGLLALGAPVALHRASGGRGRLRWWFAGTGLALTIGLVAPMSDSAGSAIGQYGHWPSVVVSDGLGIEGNALRGANESIAGAVGGLLTGDPGSPQPLGDAAADDASETSESSQSPPAE
ncbi:MAG: hypothetical protein ABEL76_06170 [Bradymonadaceae bacterium]